MKRRAFISKSALGVVGTTLVPHFLKGMDVLGMPTGAKRLIVIQLSGGNDGLNTVIPYENDIYYQHRPKVGIAKDEVLKLNDELGLNPNMDAFHDLFKDKVSKLAYFHSPVTQTVKARIQKHEQIFICCTEFANFSFQSRNEPL